MAPHCGVFGARHVLSSQQSAENFAPRGQAHLGISLRYLGRVTSSRSFVARVSGSRELGLVSPPRTIPRTLDRHSLVYFAKFLGCGSRLQIGRARTPSDGTAPTWDLEIS